MARIVHLNRVPARQKIAIGVAYSEEGDPDATFACLTCEVQMQRDDDIWICKDCGYELEPGPAEELIVEVERALFGLREKTKLQKNGKGLWAWMKRTVTAIYRAVV